ncbi:MAG: Uma2 family endonuclease [Acidobacteria bacterium]|nr:Uma2 family endonuclease [Acidobacteriota bacterium]
MAAPATRVGTVAASPADVAEPPPAGGAGGTPSTAASPDAPVRVEVAMPRALFDRLTDHDDAPRCRYDEHTGLAEFVAQPGFAHEGPAWQIGQLFARIADALAERGHDVAWQPAGALRLLSDDGAFEPDAGFYLDPEAERAVRRVEGYLDVRNGLPPPDLVVEIDRSRRSRLKLAPYFRMGVKEAWTWNRKEGASLWRPDPSESEGFRAVPESHLCPGLTRDDLDRLCARGVPAVERAQLSRRLARHVAERLAPTAPSRP